MDLLEEILKGVGNDKKLNSHSKDKSPLNDLIAGYTKEAQHDDNLPNMGEESTGRDFKDGLAKLPAIKQVDLLALYNEAVRCLDPNYHKEDPDKVEQRQIRRMLIKTAIYGGGTMTVAMVTAVGIVGYRSGVFDNAALGTLLSTATEIFKLIFTSN